MKQKTKKFIKAEIAAILDISFAYGSKYGQGKYAYKQKFLKFRDEMLKDMEETSSIHEQETRKGKEL